jgi:elongation factor P hydroxylase
MTRHAEIAGRFNARFRGHGPRGVLLIGGAAEPVYLPATRRRPALIRYTRDFAQSALHEIAHWCQANAAARRLVDYGLWYDPPPRTAAAQARFYAAEVPVQALEMLLAHACAVPFHFSADNPGADAGPARQRFEHQVRVACRALVEDGLNLRARAVLTALNPHWRKRAEPPQ